MKDYQFICRNFSANVEGVYKLLLLDELILDETIKILEDRQQSLKNSGIENADMLADNHLQQLKNIRKNDSLKSSYKLIHNQCIVLLVSYFSSSMHDLFDIAVTHIIHDRLPKKIEAKEVKFTLAELKSYDFDISSNVGTIISNKFNISFQDMGSISRALKDYLGISIPWDRTVNNIIAMQACRHAIAHAGEVADEKLLGQLKPAGDRDIQNDISIGQRIEFSPKEVRVGGEQMKNYLNSVVASLERKFKS